MKLQLVKPPNNLNSVEGSHSMGKLDYKWIVTISTIVGTFMTALAQTIVNISIPKLETAFNAPLSDVQWVLTAYILAQGILTPTSAFFSNRLGIKNSYLFPLIIMVAYLLGFPLDQFLFF